MFAIAGDVFHTPDFGNVEAVFDALVVVQARAEGGRILRVEAGVAGDDEREGALLQECGVAPGSVLRLKKGQFLTPGLIDTHYHAPQTEFTGTATDTPLMQWLEQYAFPTERSCANLAHARDVYTKAVRRTLRLGTTCIAYYGSMDGPGCRMLADCCLAQGQRAYVGLPTIDQNGGPGYQLTTQEALEVTETFVQYVQALGNDTVRPVVTPRFVPTCSKQLLRGMGEIAAKYDCHIQTHVAESMDQVLFSEQLHPQISGRDARLYDVCGLLTDKTLLAHAGYLTPDEHSLLAERGAAIAHCPLSNLYFAEQILPVKRLLRKGLKIGLGTDVAAGSDPNMLSAVRNAVLSSRARHVSAVDAALRARGGDVGAARRDVPPSPRDEEILSYKEAFWLATVGSARALAIQDKVGLIAPGLEFDALLVDATTGHRFDVYPSDSPQDVFEKWVNLGDDRSVAGAWVKGRRVVG